MPICVAVIAVGLPSYSLWSSTFAPNLRRWCARHGYALEVFTEPLDPSRTDRSISWQKLLLAGHPRLSGYDRIHYFDHDVLLSPIAPPLEVPDGKIGAVTWRGSYHGDPVFYEAMRETWKHNYMKWVMDANIDSFARLAEVGGYPPHEDWMNAGVMSFQPRHADFFAEVYKEPDHERSSLEQQALTHWLCNRRADLLHPLDRRWNQVFDVLTVTHYAFLPLLYPKSFIVAKCVECALRNHFAVHFAGGGEREEARAYMEMEHLREDAA